MPDAPYPLHEHMRRLTDTLVALQVQLRDPDGRALFTPGAPGRTQTQLLGPDGNVITPSNPLAVRAQQLEQAIADLLAALENGLPLKGRVLTAPPVTGVKTVTSTPAEVFAGASRLVGRSVLMIRNLHPSLRIRVGSSTVTDETGFGVEPGALIQLRLDPHAEIPIYAVSEAGNVEVEVLEV